MPNPPFTYVTFVSQGYSGPSVLDLSHHAVMALERQTKERPRLLVDIKDIKDIKERPRLLVDWSGEGREVWEQRLNDRETQGK
eukprot:6594479-Pyramimonas_sp.AAC.1